MLGTGIGQAYDFLFPTYQGWSDYGTAGSGSNQRRRALYLWTTNGNNPKLGLVVSYKTNTAVTYETRTYPAKGNYTFSGTDSYGKIAIYYWTIGGSKRYSYWLNSSGTMFYPASGTVTFGEGGGDAPYVTCNSMGVENGSGQNVGSVSFACGTAPTYATITINRNDNSMGSASAAYKSGYIYPNSRDYEYKVGSTYTLTATANTGYQFVEWQKNGSRISTTATTDVQITGTATYTAVFEAEGVSYADGVITATPNNASYGTVTGTADAATFVSGTNYTGGTSISLTATPNAGYYFSNWSDGVNTASRSFTVDGLKTITANFVAKTNYTYNWSWSEAGTNGVQDWNSPSGISYSTYILYQIQALNGGSSFPAGSFSFCLDWTNDGYWTYDSNVDAPAVGEYPVDIVATNITGVYKNHLICNGAYVNQNNGSAGSTQNKSFYQPTGTVATRQLFTSGSVVIEFGRHGDPYLYSKNLENATCMFNLSIGQGRNLTTTYTSVTVGKSEDYKKAVMYAYDGSNTLCLAFDVASIDANIGIPAGTYTVGTNVNGTLADDDGHSYWKLTGGTITISKSGSALSMTTSSLTAIDDDDQNQNLNLTISNRTPTLTNITNIPVGSASVNKYSGYFNVQGTSGTYAVALESASVNYRTGFFGNYELENTNTYTYLKNNNSHIALNYKRQMMKVTEVGGNIFTEAFLYSTSGTIYRIAAFNGAYAITYKDQGNVAYSGNNSGSLPASHIYGSNTTLVNGTKAGATFDGWYENSSCTGSPVTVIGATDKTAAFTLYAKWAVSSFHLAWDANGGVLVDNEVYSYAVEGDYPSGEELPDGAPNATREGYQLTGWYDAEHDLTWTDDDWTMPNHDVTYTAQWAANTYNLTYEGLNGATNSNPATYTIETATFALANPGTRAGYTFTGWTCGGNPITQITLGSTGDKTITANWSTVTYNLTYQGLNGATNSNPATYTVETATFALANPGTRDGYTFTGWTCGGNPITQITIGSTGDKTITANWSAVTYDLTYEGLNGATNSNPATYTVETATFALANPGTRDGYTFTGWTCGGDAITQIVQGSTGDKTITANWSQNTYTVTIVSNNAEYGTVSPASVASVPYGTTITTSTNTINVNGTTVTATKTADNAQYTYTFDGWTIGTATVTGAMTVTANFSRTTQTYTVTWKNGETTLETDENVAYGATPAYDGATPTKDATAEYTYAFSAWTPAIASVTGDATYTATFTQTPVNYTLTWTTDGDALTGTYTSGTVAYGTAIEAPNTPTKTGYSFTGWRSSISDNVETPSTMPAQNLTYTATWEIAFSGIILWDNKDDDYYDAFKANDGTTADVLYPRQFKQGNWSTLCLPFNVNRGTMMTQKLNGSVYEFKYATGDANEGDNVMLYFAKANTMEAGKCYIVNANSTLAAKTSFTFSNVTFNLANDLEEHLTSASAYDNLPETKTQGTIGLVGTLRKGTLIGTATGNTYMGLKNNKIWYPNPSVGNVILAYRGLFRSTEALNAGRVRIVVEGETVTELEVVNGEMVEATEAKKFVQDGILYIERDGVIYNAQGQKVN